MKKTILFLISLVLLSIPAISLAAGEFVYDFTLISESTEKTLEVVNLILALFAAAVAIKLAALAQGGQLEKTWNWLAIAIVTFAGLEIYGALVGFGLVHIGGLGDVLEFAMVVIFVYILFTTRRRLLKAMLG